MAGDYYAILGVPRTATREEIQLACRRMAELYNPNLNRDNPFAENIYRKVEEARETLIDTEKRQAYDALLQEREAATAAASPSPAAQPGAFSATAGTAGQDIPKAPAPEEALRAFFSQSIRAEQEKNSTFRDYRHSRIPATAGTAGQDIPKAPAPEEDLRAFFSQSLRAEQEKNPTFRDYLHSRIPAIVGGSVLLIDVLVWIFGLRIAEGRFVFLLRSSYLTLIGWGGYAALRHYTANVIFALLYSLSCGVIYALFIVRLYIVPDLYPETPVSRLFIGKTAVHFFIFYLTFFCATQMLEKGGFNTIRERLFG
ncbi:MAG: J domain-containing protein [Synergistaceae bacterium]|nr:J domain-containing protein [Synergistaceae bacterium]